MTTARVKLASRTITVTIQREHDGACWATSGEHNSDKGYTLKANGDAYRETYRNGERVSSERVGTWTR